MSAAFRGPSAGLGTELYRGAQAYYTEINQRGGVHGRTISVVALDDGYEPTPCIKNTIELVEKEQVFFSLELRRHSHAHPRASRDQALRRSPGDPRRQLHRRAAAARGAVRRAGLQHPGFVPAGDDGPGRPLLADRRTKVRRLLPDRRLRAQRDRRRGPGLAQRGRDDRGRGDVPAPRQVRRRHEARPFRRSAGPGSTWSQCTGAYQGCGAFVRTARDLGWTVPISNVSFVGSEAMLSLLLNHGKTAGRDYTRGLINSQVVPSYDDVSLPAVVEYRTLMDKHNPQLPQGLRDPSTRRSSSASAAWRASSTPR